MASQHMEKGNQVYVSGRLVSDVLEGEDGKRQVYYKRSKSMFKSLLEIYYPSLLSLVIVQLIHPFIQPPSQDKLSQEVTVKHSIASNIEMKRGDWLCPKNFILGCWSKDVKHILPLMNCGTSDAPSKNESACQSLIREIYMFLDRNGYICRICLSARHSNALQFISFWSYTRFKRQGKCHHSSFISFLGWNSKNNI